MSQENVEIVRTGCEAWLRGDLDTMFETCKPDVEWDTTRLEGWMENKVYRGQGEVRRFLEEWLASWDWESHEASFELLDKGNKSSCSGPSAWPAGEAVLRSNWTLPRSKPFETERSAASITTPTQTRPSKPLGWMPLTLGCAGRLL
jgi:hypothetical protein